ncbi:hypothetical protein D3C76_1453330 [compost metagenome]
MLKLVLPEPLLLLLALELPQVLGLPLQLLQAKYLVKLVDLLASESLSQRPQQYLELLQLLYQTQQQQGFGLHQLYRQLVPRFQQQLLCLRPNQER